MAERKAVVWVEWMDGTKVARMVTGSVGMKGVQLGIQRAGKKVRCLVNSKVENLVSGTVAR